MRVFYFLTKSEQGGAQTVVSELVRSHMQRGDSVCVMAGGEGWLAHTVSALGARYVENPFIKKTYNPLVLLKAALLYRKRVKEFRPHVVSTHNSFSGFIGRMFRVSGIPVVYTTHGWGFQYASFPMNFFGLVLEKLAGWRTNAIVCVSESDRRIARRYRIVPEKKLHLIYNGVSVGCFETKKGTPIVTFVGRFAWPKQQQLLVDAFLLCPESIRTSTRLLFIGDGSQLSAVKRNVVSHGIQQRVVFTGSITHEETIRHLCESSLSVLFSHSEGFPMSIVESLQCGVPVVAHNVGGIKEIVDDTVGALLPPSVSAKEIADVLSGLLENADRLAVLSEQAKARGAQFSADRMTRDIYNLYATLT